MCQSQAKGGQRCAAHTRTKYQAADPGTDAWDKAAAEFASTPTGRNELGQALQEAREDGDMHRVVAIEHALTEGTNLRARSAEVRKQLAAAANTPEAPTSQTQVETVLADLSNNLGYDRMTLRRQYANTGTAVFQRGNETHEVKYDFQNRGFKLTLPAAPEGYAGIPAQDRSGIVSYVDGNGLVLSSNWNNPNDTRKVLNALSTILNKPTSTGQPKPLAPVSQEQAETQLIDMANTHEYQTTFERQWANTGTVTFTKNGKSHKVRYDYQDRGFKLTLPAAPEGYAGIPAQDRSGIISYLDGNGLVLTSNWNNTNDTRKVFNTLSAILTR